MNRLAIAALVSLAACSTPRERCEQDATRDLNAVSALIVETEQNIARGYAIRRELEERPDIRFCVGDRFNNHVGLVFCNDTETRVVTRPEAIDLAAERAKLADLRKKQVELRRRTARALAACARLDPNG